MNDTFRKNYNDSPNLKEKQLDIKNIAEQLEIKIKDIGQSREVSLALTNLEQSIMWAVKALYISGDKNENQ